MPAITPAGATIPGVTHHLAEVNGTRLHYVSAGTTGSTILLVHGWPETWWAFRKLIPLLAATHRVVAVDLRGFGDSGAADGAYDDATSAEDLHHLVTHLGAGPVHLLCQDISGGPGFRFAATHPGDVRSLTAVETTLPGYGLESLADVNHGGSWHVGFLGAPGIPEMLLPGHERQLLAGWAYPMMTATKDAVTDADLDEFVRCYARPHGWRGTAGLYQAIFADAGSTRALAEAHPLTMPVLTVDAVSAPFTEQTFRQVTAGELTAVRLAGVGHLVAQEAPGALAAAILKFLGPL
ncbi:alpha/beta fold hydrolase [Actinoplanes auranticolor]|uniref:Alpha/beta hydrolase n=1 Tax=Actinoplanes auranticolor TaxID=47988 RepID=A0A919VQ63_9ACTN|nr:alpha/beta hydrolase [Actinoplanes auranticolor]GIM65068.1 alpha/beta hydrolase [Actinoplanes auranticolor]